MTLQRWDPFADMRRFHNYFERRRPGFQATGVPAAGYHAVKNSWYIPLDAVEEDSEGGRNAAEVVEQPVEDTALALLAARSPGEQVFGRDTPPSESASLARSGLGLLNAVGVLPVIAVPVVPAAFVRVRQHAVSLVDGLEFLFRG